VSFAFTIRTLEALGGSDRVMILCGSSWRVSPLLLLATLALIAAPARAVLTINEGIAMYDLCQSFYGGIGTWTCATVTDAQNNACSWSGVTCDGTLTHITSLYDILYITFITLILCCVPRKCCWSISVVEELKSISFHYSPPHYAPALPH